MRPRPGLFPGMRRGGRGGRGGRLDPYLLMLVLQLANRIQRLERKPPVTLGLMAVMAYLHVYQGASYVPSAEAYALCPSLVIETGDVHRLFISALLHGKNDFHLYHNLASLLWKGYYLEFQLGSISFSWLLVQLLILVNGLIVALSWVGHHFQLYPGPYDSCLVGFSYVLFAIKVIMNAKATGHSQVYFIRVPTKYACWLELVFIHLFVRRTSLFGHLCGILAGYLFLYQQQIMAWLATLIHSSASAPSYTYTSEPLNTPAASADTENVPEEDMAEIPPATGPTINELRRRRLQVYE